MAGSITVATSNAGAGVWATTISWTSDAAGAVNGNTFLMHAGTIILVEFTPGSGGAQPTDLYDVDLEDVHNVSVFDNGGGTSIGSNLSNVVSSHSLPLIGLSAISMYRRWHPAGAFELLVTNAGNAKSGTVTIYVHRGVL